MEISFHIKIHNYTKFILEKVMEEHRGQGKEIYWRDNNICPTEEQYEQMVLGSEHVVMI